MFAETDFGLMADSTLDVSSKMSVVFLVTLALIAIGALVALAWNLRGVF